MQLRFDTGLTGAEYVTRQGWLLASLPHCPVHGPDGKCSFAGHGTYGRKTPRGTRIARWYCREAHQTFSLLPDFLAARFPGTLHAIEEVVAAVEQGPSLEKAADRLGSADITLSSAVRWVRRRVSRVRQLLWSVIELFPQRLGGCMPRLASLRKCLGCNGVLVMLRDVAEVHLQKLAPPLGFKHPRHAGADRQNRFQQHTGLDPPPKPA